MSSDEKVAKIFFAIGNLYLSNLYFCALITVAVAQLVRASDCGSEGRRFETGQSPRSPALSGRFLFIQVYNHSSFQG